MADVTLDFDAGSFLGGNLRFAFGLVYTERMTANGHVLLDDVLVEY